MCRRKALLERVLIEHDNDDSEYSKPFQAGTGSLLGQQICIFFLKRPVYLAVNAPCICTEAVHNLFIGICDINCHNDDREIGPSGEGGVLIDAL